jgi:hypothetical protein
MNSIKHLVLGSDGTLVNANVISCKVIKVFGYIGDIIVTEIFTFDTKCVLKCRDDFIHISKNQTYTTNKCSQKEQYDIKSIKDDETKVYLDFFADGKCVSCCFYIMFMKYFKKFDSCLFESKDQTDLPLYFIKARNYEIVFVKELEFELKNEYKCAIKENGKYLSYSSNKFGESDSIGTFETFYFNHIDKDCVNITFTINETFNI